MSKSIAVAGAIANQLHHEGHWPPNDLNKVMGAGYHYDHNSMANFLVAVRWNLANGSPPYYFQFDDPFTVAALALSVGQLTGAVDAKTTEDKPPGWVDP
jgi:hypothetical protein